MFHGRFVNPAQIKLLCILLFAGCAPTGGGAKVTSPLSPAQEFTLPSLDGGSVSISDFRGRVVVLDFWATWCLPCRQRLAHLQTLAGDQKLARQGLVILAIDEQDDASKIRSFLCQFHYTFTTLCDTDATVARTYSVFSLPTTFVIGRNGNIRSVIAADADAGQLDAAIGTALQRAAP